MAINTFSSVVPEQDIKALRAFTHYEIPHLITQNANGEHMVAHRHLGGIEMQSLTRSMKTGGCSVQNYILLQKPDHFYVLYVVKSI